MYNNMNNIKRISGYNQAARYFEETKKPKTSRWGEDERPLYNTRSHHYRIVKGTDNGVPFYDLVLYATSMIRYYKPDAYDHQRVLVRGHQSTASGNFLWYHGFARGRELACVDGYGAIRSGKLLLNQAVHNADKYGVPYNWSANLMFIGEPTDGYRIDLTRSCHVPGYKAASSAEDKAERKKLKVALDHWIELLGYRLDDYLNGKPDANNWQVQRAGESFTSALDLISYSDIQSIRDALKAVLKDDDASLMDSEHFVNAMTELGQAVTTHLQGIRENKAQGRWDYQLRQYTENKPVEPVTRDDFRKSMESHIISLLNLRTGSARVDIGQFPASIPRKWWC